MNLKNQINAFGEGIVETNKATQRIEKLNREYIEAFKNNEIVLGGGCIGSPLVIIGEAPGKDEVKLGKPFVGSAGKNLNEFINILSIERESLYITNAIKYRLGKLNPKTQRVVNRPATIQDIKDNQPWLHKEISLLKPKVIVTLGNVPLKSVTDDFNITIGSSHGTLCTCYILEEEYKLFPLYHPASIIYNRSLKDVYNQDMLVLKQEILNFLK